MSPDEEIAGDLMTGCLKFVGIVILVVAGAVSLIMLVNHLTGR